MNTTPDLAARLDLARGLMTRAQMTPPQYSPSYRTDPAVAIFMGTPTNGTQTLTASVLQLGPQQALTHLSHAPPPTDPHFIRQVIRGGVSRAVDCRDD